VVSSAGTVGESTTALLLLVPDPPIGSPLMRRPPVAPRVRRSAIPAALLLTVALVVVSATIPATIPASAQTTPKVVAKSLRVRAMGDGVTAGFGEDASGTPVDVAQRPECRTTEPVPNGRCSSNSRLGAGATDDAPAFSADFGLADGVSWAAQVARTLGATDYANYAVSGSTPVDWMNLPHDDATPAEGSLHGLVDRIASDDPDLVLVSLGGSILLQLPGGSAPACAVFRDPAAQRADFESCIAAILDRTLVKQDLMAISFDILARTLNAKIIFTTYLPPSPTVTLLEQWQIDSMTDLVNKQIIQAYESVGESGSAWASRIAYSVQNTVEVDGRCTQSPRIPWLRLAIDGIGRGCPIVDPRFAPVSLGTVPNAATQTGIAQGALGAIHANGWG
jgi:hypothetical protein